MGTLLHAVGHGLSASDTILLANLVGGEGLEENTLYYVLAAGLTADDFAVSETDGGAAIVYTTDITEGSIVSNDVYTAVSDGVMDPPDPVPTPSLPTLTSAAVSGIVRLRIELNDTAEAKVRLWEVQVTSKFSGADADWGTPQTFSLPEGSLDLSMPALGSTIYAVRVRAQDVYGNYSAYCADSTVTTAAGSDSLNAALADLANDVADGIITETKIADDAISTPKLQAGAVTAEVLAATIVLASLLKTADTGRRIELDIEGIRLIDTDESLLVRIPTNGDPVYVKGEVSADSLVSQTAAEFRGEASLTGDAVMTLQNGVSAPAVAPSLAATVDSLTLTSTPGSVAASAGIAYDSAAGTFWLACDPTVSPYYVAQEFNATTGALVRSIASTGSIITTTATLGSTSHVTDTADGVTGSTNSHFATPLTIPGGLTNVKVTKVAAYLAGRLGSATCRTAVWDDVSGTGNALGYSDVFTASSGGATTLGASDLYNKAMSFSTPVTSGQTYYFGFYHNDAAQGIQFDKDDGAGKTTYSGDGTGVDGTGWATYDSAGKPNVYATYTYDTDTRLETAKNIGVCTDGTHIYTLDNTGVVWKYLRSDGSYVTNTAVLSDITGTKTKAGLFYDATAGKLVITTTTGTGAGVYPKFVQVDPTTLTVGTMYSAAAGTTFSGTADSFRGGARLNDPLNASAATYWVATTSAVYAYTFSGSTATQTSNRDFGTAATVGHGLTHDGTQFRGWATGTPTKVWKFSAWDWTTTSTTLWVGYAWYDSAGTTHETAMGPRASLTIRRRERVQVQNPAIPTGGVDDPDKVRIYALQNATDTGAGAHWLQVTDALTSRYLITYTGSGTNDGSGTPFAAGTPAEIRSALAVASGGWSLKGDGTFEYPHPLPERARASGNLTLTTSSTDVTGATITRVSPVAETVLVTAAFDFETSAVGTGYAYGRLYVDGVHENVGDAVGQRRTGAGRVTAFQQWVVSVSAASHTYKLQAYKTANDGTTTVIAVNTSITITPFPTTGGT